MKLIRSESRGRVLADTGLIAWIAAVLVAIIADGALRKWVLPSSYAAVGYFLKDVVALAFIARHPLRSHHLTLRNLRIGLIPLACVLSIPLAIGLTVVAPSALATYKNIILWPLFAIHLAAYIRATDFPKIGFLVACITLLQCSVAMAQFNSSPSSWLNQYAWTDLDREGGLVAGHARATGTFSYIAGLSHFSIFAFGVMFWIAIAWRPRRMASNVIRVAIAASVAMSILSGSRAAFVIQAVMVLALPMFSRSLKHLWLGLGILVPTVLVVSVTVPDAIEAFTQRWETSNDTMYDRVTGEGLKADYWELMNQYPLGLGLGATSGYGAYSQGLRTGEDDSFDHPGSKGIAEAGVFGYLVLKFYLLVAVWLGFRALMASSATYRSATVLLGFAPLYWICSNIWYDHNGTAIYWFMMSLWLNREPSVMKAARADRAKALVVALVPRGMTQQVSSCPSTELVSKA